MAARFYRALESVSMASTLSTALTICPCQIRVHQRHPKIPLFIFKAQLDLFS